MNRTKLNLGEKSPPLPTTRPKAPLSPHSPKKNVNNTINPLADLSASNPVNTNNNNNATTSPTMGSPRSRAFMKLGKLPSMEQMATFLFNDDDAQQQQPNSAGPPLGPAQVSSPLFTQVSQPSPQLPPQPQPASQSPRHRAQALLLQQQQQQQNANSLQSVGSGRREKERDSTRDPLPNIPVSPQPTSKKFIKFAANETDHPGISASHVGPIGDAADTKGLAKKDIVSLARRFRSTDERAMGFSQQDELEKVSSADGKMYSSVRNEDAPGSSNKFKKSLSIFQRKKSMAAQQDEENSGDGVATDQQDEEPVPLDRSKSGKSPFRQTLSRASSRFSIGVTGGGNNRSDSVIKLQGDLEKFDAASGGTTGDEGAVDSLPFAPDPDFKYQISDRILGEGMFSEVRMGIRKSDDRPVAVKIIKKKGMFNRDASFTLKHESAFFKLGLHHENIVDTYEMTIISRQPVIVMEYVPGGHLKHLVDSYNLEGGLSPRVCKAIFHQIMKGLAFLHSHLVAHRDMKPENLLLDYGGSTTSTMDAPSPGTDLRDVIPVVKIADFGMCKVFDKENSKVSGKFGSPLYMAPEVVNYSDYGVEVDVWSVAAVVYFMYTGTELFDGNTSDEVIEKVKTMPVNLTSVVSKGARSLLAKMLLRDRRHRITAADALDSPWFSMDEEAETENVSLSRTESPQEPMLALAGLMSPRGPSTGLRNDSSSIVSNSGNTSREPSSQIDMTPESIATGSTNFDHIFSPHTVAGYGVFSPSGVNRQMPTRAKSAEGTR
mmetsp:Transcript_21821/g.37599  ORF Transcript_21821/g.37599 Transcript_21821/m.37599 type:complete len:773 (-) Transcript_21821:133-2451(-)